MVGGARRGASSSFRVRAVRRGRPGVATSGNGGASAGRAPGAVGFAYADLRPRGSAVAVPSDGRAEATKETTRASVSSRARAEGERKRRRPSAGVVSTRASACPRARTSLHCALVMSAEPATYPVTLSVYACSCASARGRSSAASATVHTAAAIARRAISPAGTASRRRSGVGRRAAPRSFPRIAKADRDATRGVLDQIYRFERNSGCKLYGVASGKNSGETIWGNSLQIPRGWLRDLARHRRVAFGHSDCASLRRFQ